MLDQTVFVKFNIPCRDDNNDPVYFFRVMKFPNMDCVIESEDLHSFRDLKSRIYPSIPDRLYIVDYIEIIGFTDGEYYDVEY